MDIRPFIRELVSKSIYPTLQTLTDKLGTRIERAIQSKESPTALELTNAGEIYTPIEEGLKGVEKAVREQTYPTEVSVLNMEKTDLSRLEKLTEQLKETLEKKEMKVNVGKTKVEVNTKEVVKAIEKLYEAMPKMEKQEVIDYTLILDEMCQIMEKPHYTLDIQKIQDTLNRLATTEDMGIIAEYLQVLIDKKQPEFPELKFTKDGELMVKVDRVGGGGGGLTQDESLAIQAVATEETQKSVLSAIQGLGGGNYKKRVAESGGYVYVGYAAMASDTSAAVWRIKRIGATGSEDWADGDDQFNNIWDNYATLTYL